MISAKVNSKRLGNFRFKKIGKNYLITNDVGNWQYLSSENFKRFLNAKISQKEKIYQELSGKGFIDINKKKLAELAGQYLTLNYSSFKGPTLFIIVLTLRCNHRCLYCQVTPESPMAKGFDMNEATAKKAVDLIFRAPSRFISIEFQGGEPVINWPVLKYIVKYAKEVNKEKNKNLKISLVSNLTLLDEKKLNFLLKEDVSISCSFDGPAKVHNKNRIFLEGGNSYEIVSKQIKKIQKTIKIKKKKSKRKFVDSLNAILTVSRFSLPYYKEIVDEYIKTGFDNIFIRPLSPFGLQRQTLNIIGYRAEEFIDFYKKSMDYILKLNLEGKLFVERNAYYALKKILKNEDANYLEMRSPCGAGIGQMAFNYDGGIFTCDEGRMVERMGYENFKLGDVYNNNFNQLIDNEITKTMCLASCLDNQFSCLNCAYKPYCGVCPVANFIEYGTIFPQISNTDKCKINKAMFYYLFSKIRNKKYRNIFENWLEKLPYLNEKDYSKK